MKIDMRLEKFVHHGNYFCSITFRDGYSMSCHYEKIFRDRYGLDASDVDTCEINASGYLLICKNHYKIIESTEFKDCMPIHKIVKEEKNKNFSITSFTRLYQVMRKILKI
jgi:hypothetical protein